MNNRYIVVFVLKGSKYYYDEFVSLATFSSKEEAEAAIKDYFDHEDTYGALKGANLYDTQNEDFKPYLIEEECYSE